MARHDRGHPSSSATSTATASTRQELLTRLSGLFDHVSGSKASQLLDRIATNPGRATRNDDDPDQRLKGLSLRYTINLQPELSEAITSTHSTLKKTVREHEALARADRQRWIRQKEEADGKKQLNQDSLLVPVSNAPGTTKPASIRPPWEPLVGHRNLQDVLSLLLHLQQAPDVSTQSHATILVSGSSISASIFSRRDQDRADRALRDFILESDPLTGDVWERSHNGFSQREAEGNAQLDSDQDGWTSSEDEREVGFQHDPRNQQKTDETPDRSKEAKEGKLRDQHVQTLRRREQRRTKITEEAKVDREQYLLLKQNFESLKHGRYWQEHVCTSENRTSLSEAETMAECLFAMQGLQSVLFKRDPASSNTKMNSSASSMRPRHLSASTFVSLLTDVERYSSTLVSLRRFVSSSRVSNHVSSTSSDAVLQALGASVASLLSKFGQILLQRQEDLVSLASNCTQSGGSDNRVVSLVSLVAEIEREGQALRALEEILIDSGALLIQDQQRYHLRPPEPISSLVLDALQGAVAFYWSLYDASTAVTEGQRTSSEEQTRSGFLKTAEDLGRCFLDAAEPLWEEIKLWVGEGMEMHFDKEVESDRQDQNRANRNTHDLPRSNRSDSSMDLCFARRNLDIAAQDGRFWKEGWVTSVCSSAASITSSDRVGPSFISPLAEGILQTGKYVGLLRALGWEAEILHDQRKNESLKGILDSNNDSLISEPSIIPIQSTAESSQDHIRGRLFGDQNVQNLQSEHSTVQDSDPSHPDDEDHTFRFDHVGSSGIPSSSPPSLSSSSSSISSSSQPPDSTDDAVKAPQMHLSELLSSSAFTSRLSSYLQPRLTLVQRKLHGVLTSGWEEQGCDLPAHVEGFLGLFLWRKGREMSQWINVIFEQVDDGKVSIFDPQILNAAFREEAISSALHGGGAWIDTSLVRFVPARKTRTRGRDWAIGSGVRALAALRVDYLVPFPLTYFFSPSLQAHYQALFTLQLQLTRARYLLTRMSPTRPGKFRQDPGFNYRSEGAAKFIQIRKRLLWLVGVLSDFVTRDVIETNSQSMLSQLSDLVAYDSLIDLHSSSIKKIAALCFLRGTPSSADQEAPFETEVDTEAVVALRLGTDIKELILDILDCADEVAASYRHWTGFRSIHQEDDSQHLREQASRRRRRRRKEKEARIKSSSERFMRAQHAEDEDDGEEEGIDKGTSIASTSEIRINPTTPTSMISNVSFSLSEAEEPFSSKIKRLSFELEKDVGRLKTALHLKIGRAAGQGEVEARSQWQALAYRLEEFG